MNALSVYREFGEAQLDLDVVFPSRGSWRFEALVHHCGSAVAQTEAGVIDALRHYGGRQSFTVSFGGDERLVEVGYRTMAEGWRKNHVRAAPQDEWDRLHLGEILSAVEMGREDDGLRVAARQRDTHSGLSDQEDIYCALVASKQALSLDSVGRDRLFGVERTVEEIVYRAVQLESFPSVEGEPNAHAVPKLERVLRRLGIDVLEPGLWNIQGADSRTG